MPRDLLRSVPTSVTGAQLKVEEYTSGGKRVRELSLAGQCQSEVVVLGDGSLSVQQPLELVQIMVLATLGWLPSHEQQQRVLLCGLGGGSIARALAALMPPAASVHSVELEPEVVAAATQFFGVQLSEPRCTAEAADCAAFLAGAAAQRRSFEVLILDAFDSEGLSESVQKRTALDDAAACCGGLLIVNLHTARDLSDPDYAQSRRVLRDLCRRFDAVYKLDCASTLNLIALAHDGPMRDADDWGAMLRAQLGRPEVGAACTGFELQPTLERLDFVGGRDEPPSL